MADGPLYALAWGCKVLGMGWLALAQRAHQRQVFGKRRLSPRATRRLRLAGVAALASALVLCLLADHPAMAALVWVMGLSAAALLVTFVLAFRPQALRWLGIVLGHAL